MFLQTDDHAHLLGGIGSARRSDVGWSVYKIMDNDLAGFVLEVFLLDRKKRWRVASSYDQRDEAAERSM
jgi:hypothetical protein